ncbi:MAG TPA: tetratricopeptide repeat protein, partial [Rubricoccaceae bacterium]
VPLFTDAADLLPDSTQGHFYLGLAHYSAGNATAAIAPLRTAVRMAPSDPQAALYLGRVLIQADQGTEGIAVLSDAAGRFPNDASLRAELLNAYQRTGRAGEAISLYEAALVSPSPADEPVLRFNYGTVLLQAGRVDDAIAQFERAIELQPENFDAQYNLGAAYQNQAAAINRRANEATDNAENRRLVAERNVFLERSLPYFERARTVAAEGPNRTGACTALFQVYTTLGRIDDARAVASCAGISMN